MAFFQITHICIFRARVRTAMDERRLDAGRELLLRMHPESGWRIGHGHGHGHENNMSSGVLWDGGELR